MGCGGSRLDGNGVGLPPRLRPLFLLRLEEFRMRKRTQPVKADSSPSTSELLLHGRDEDENSPAPHKNIAPHGTPMYRNDRKYEESGNEQKYERKRGASRDGNSKDESEYEDALTDVYNDDDDDDDDMEDEDGRRIGRGDFPGSPSFRVYFKDDGEDKHINDHGEVMDNAHKRTFSSDDDTLLSKESPDQNKKVKRGRKKKSFRKVLPKGGQAAVKNLLSVKSCYTPSSSAHRHHHLLTEKTTASSDDKS